MRDEDIKQVFNGLVNNAFDFLTRSATEFDNDIKYSIIHFCVAVENILKAELLHNDWRLIFRKSENASWDNFITGDFQSVSLGETITRLREIAQKDIPEEAENCFLDIAKERNKIIHFCNWNLSKEEIAIKQFTAWYYIDKLLRSWHGHFNKFLKEKRKFRSLMAKQIKYLEIRYDKIKPVLDKLDKDKIFLATCPSCKYDALVLSVSELHVRDERCRVCDVSSRGIVIHCPDCGELTLLTDDYTTTCKCHRRIDSDELIDIIENKLSYYADIPHGEEVDWLANCTECDGHESAIKLAEDVWFCTECFATFDKASCCEWCNEFYTGEKEDTYMFGCGCGCCEGCAAKLMDD